MEPVFTVKSTYLQESKRTGETQDAELVVSSVDKYSNDPLGIVVSTSSLPEHPEIPTPLFVLKISFPYFLFFPLF